MRLLLFITLLLSHEALSAGAIGRAAGKPFSNMVRSTAGKAAERLLENMVDDAYSKLNEKKKTGKDPEPCEKIPNGALKRFTRKFKVDAKAITICNVSPSKIKEISYIDGNWKCCGQTKEVNYLGYDAQPHVGCGEIRKNTDYNYMCLLCDVGGIQGQLTKTGIHIADKTQQIIFWSNDEAQKGIGGIDVTLLCEEQES